jgi:hypothetical protein
MARPTGQFHQIGGLLGEPHRQFGTIDLGCRTTRAAVPRVAQHVATLEILAVIGLLEHNVFWKRFGVVAYMQTRHKGRRSVRHCILFGTFATLLLVAVLTPGIYPLLINRSADRIATAPQGDPLARAPVPTLLQPLPESNPAAAGPAGQPPAAPPASETAHALRPPSSAEQKQLRTVTAGADPAGGVVPDRQVSPLPSASVAPRALAPQSTAAPEPPAAPPAAARAPIQALAAAKSRVTEEGGFFVQLSAPKSEAEAQSTLRALKSKYAVLKGREPVIRRKDEGQRGVFYAVQVGPFESRDDADRLCKQVKAAGGICFVARN